MNSFDLLQAYVAALDKRMRKLEIEFGQMRPLRSDDVDAQRVAQELGFDLEVLTVRKRIRERRALAAELRRRRWSHERIARAMNCSARTVIRNFSR